VRARVDPPPLSLSLSLSLALSLFLFLFLLSFILPFFHRAISPIAGFPSFFHSVERIRDTFRDTFRDTRTVFEKNHAPRYRGVLPVLRRWKDFLVSAHDCRLPALIDSGFPVSLHSKLKILNSDFMMFHFNIPEAYYAMAE